MAIEEPYSSINQRFVDVVDELKRFDHIKNDSKFAESIGIRVQNYADIKGKRQSLTVKILFDTIISYPVINERFILRGEEPKIFFGDSKIVLSDSKPSVGLEERVKELEELMKKLSNR